MRSPNLSKIRNRPPTDCREQPQEALYRTLHVYIHTRQKRDPSCNIQNISYRTKSRLTKTSGKTMKTSGRAPPRSCCISCPPSAAEAVAAAAVSIRTAEARSQSLTWLDSLSRWKAKRKKHGNVLTAAKPGKAGQQFASIQQTKRRAFPFARIHRILEYTANRLN